MSVFTQFRDAVVQTVVPESVRNVTAGSAGAAVGQFIKTTAAPSGNLTAAQVEAGMTGEPSQGLSPSGARIAGISVPVLALAGLALYFFTRKKGRK